MNRNLGRYGGALFGIVASLVATAAAAISNVDVVVTGPRPNETTISLINEKTGPVDSMPGQPMRYTGLESGTYRVEVRVDGKPTGAPTVLRLTDENVQLRVDSATGSIDVVRGTPLDRPFLAWVPRFDAPRSVDVVVGAGQFEAPVVRSGTVIPDGAGSEQLVLSTKKDLSGPYLLLTLRSGGGNLVIEYFDGDASRSASEPVGGAAVGFVYQTPSATGSLGLNTGRNGGLFDSRVDANGWGARYALPYAIHHSVQPSYRSEIRPVLSYQRRKYDYWTRTQSTNVPQIFSESWQRVDEDRFGVGLLGEHSRDITDSIRGTFAANVDLVYRDADLDSAQSNFCGAPGCSPAATFSSTLRDSRTGFTFAAGISAGIAYTINKNASVGIEAGYRYIDKTAVVRNPVRTINLDRPPHLADVSVDEMFIGAVFRGAF